MARYNLHRYNIHKFNLFDAYDDDAYFIWRERRLLDRIEAVAGVKQFIFYHATLSDTVILKPRVTMVYFASIQQDDYIGFSGSLTVYALARRNLPDSIMMNTVIAKNMFYNGTLLDAIYENIHVGKIAYYQARLDDSLFAFVIVGKYILSGYELLDMVLAQVSAYTILIYTGVIYGAIKPGHEIIINSGNYTARQNGVNIIHLYQGDWIFITPELVEITISPSNAKMTGEIVYTEQFI